VKVDKGHAKLLKNIIRDVGRDARAADSILFGLDAFGAIYPEAIFREALNRGTRPGRTS